MEATTFPDWKRIGRRIGKRLRDVLNPCPPTGPSVEERRAQRLRDSAIGLVYFDTFEEVESWNDADPDPIQQANQPLLRRSADRIYNAPVNDCPKTKLLLCHDYKGGYHDYESVRPPPMTCEWYSCKYLQFVDTFVYFSHKLVSIPPPTWINALHRSGVQILGTFLVEPQTPHMERLLMRKGGVLTLAKQLAEMAGAYGFDGWLLNIEQDSPTAYGTWSEDLANFLSNLRDHLGTEKRVIWYDSLTTGGDVYYQNGLTSLNAPFAEAANCLFTNYKWNEKKLADTSLLANDVGLATTSIFFGIDLWAQNTNMPKPRVTYPPEGGGGTNTGLAMSVLSASGFSAAMFAPAWPYEHFAISTSAVSAFKDGPSVADRVDQSLWTGVPLPDELFCDCHKGRPHHTQFYQDHPITRYAREYPAGSSTFFETSFTPAFQPLFSTDPGRPLRVGTQASLSSQDPQPNLLPALAKTWDEINKGPITRVVYGEINTIPQASLKVLTKLAGCYEEAGDQPMSRESTKLSSLTNLRLFSLNMPADGTLVACIDIQGKHDNPDVACGFSMTFFDVVRQVYNQVPYALHPYNIHQDNVVKLPIQQENAILVSIGVFVECESHQSIPITLMDITRIVIRPRKVVTADFGFRIVNLSLKKRSLETDAERRIVWHWESESRQHEKTWSVGMPWSHTTGPFSSFTVRIDENTIGEAYCLEFPLRNDDLNDSGEMVTISVSGHLFGGGLAHSTSITVARAVLMTGGPWRTDVWS